ncbi:MAG: hypothetical protein WCC86_08070 [Methanoregula sp.]|uniref:hypothetical protein n=1 Tax=Methanoregula sp. TaxID=2052170 RepID=UPI003BB0E49A
MEQEDCTAQAGCNKDWYRIDPGLGGIGRQRWKCVRIFPSILMQTVCSTFTRLSATATKPSR